MIGIVIDVGVYCNVAFLKRTLYSRTAWNVSLGIGSIVEGSFHIPQ